MEKVALASQRSEHSDDHYAAMNPPEQTILSVLSQTSHGVSRSDLIRTTQLPRSTVHASVRKLIELGDIEEYKMANSTGGRRPALLRPTPKEALIYVAEIGTKHARIGICNIAGTLVCAKDIAVSINKGIDALLNLLKEQWEEMHEEHCADEPISAVGIAVPGPVDNQGIITGAARMPGWNQTDVQAGLAQRLNVPAIVENDARAGAIGEWAFRGEKSESSLYIKAGSGIGAAWIFDGTALRGSRGFSGEITHTRIYTDSPLPCSCGNKGCLETVSSGAAILRRLNDTDLRINSVRELLQAAKNNEYPVIPVVREAGIRIGEVLAGLVNFLNPKHVIIGGSLSQIDALIAGVRSELFRRCLPIATSELIVDVSLAKKNAPLIGMAILAREKIFQ